MTLGLKCDVLAVCVYCVMHIATQMTVSLFYVVHRTATTSSTQKAIALVRGVLSGILKDVQRGYGLLLRAVRLFSSSVKEYVTEEIAAFRVVVSIINMPALLKMSSNCRYGKTMSLLCYFEQTHDMYLSNIHIGITFQAFWHASNLYDVEGLENIRTTNVCVIFGKKVSMKHWELRVEC